MRVSRFGEYWGCSIFSGNCHTWNCLKHYRVYTHTIVHCLKYYRVYPSSCTAHPPPPPSLPKHIYTYTLSLYLLHTTTHLFWLNHLARTFQEFPKCVVIQADLCHLLRNSGWFVADLSLKKPQVCCWLDDLTATFQKFLKCVVIQADLCHLLRDSGWFVADLSLKKTSSMLLTKWSTHFCSHTLTLERGSSDFSRTHSRFSVDDKSAINLHEFLQKYLEISWEFSRIFLNDLAVDYMIDTFPFSRIDSLERFILYFYITLLHHISTSHFRLSLDDKSATNQPEFLKKLLEIFSRIPRNSVMI